MKTVLVLTMTVLAFTASHSLPRAYSPASHEGQKVKGEEGGKQRVDPGTICTTDDTGQFTCLGLGYCAANRDKPCDEFYRCTGNTDGSFKKELCACSKGYIFSDVDPNEPCVPMSSLVDRQERLYFPDESENNNYTCGNEETNTTESSNPTTTESSTITATKTNTDPEQNSTTPTKEPPTPTPPFKCEKLGSFPDPQDCHKYYECAINSSGIMTAENRPCGPGQYFDPQDSICEIGSCINPTTTTKPPKFECESLGEFQDPADCHRYYICVAGPDGQFKQPKSCKCDDGMYFDPEFGSCAYGTCP